MNRTPTRTDLMEAHEDRIRELLNAAIDQRTLARGYGSVGDAIHALPPEGPFHIQAREQLVMIAQERRRECTDAAALFEARALQMTERGIG